MKKLIFALLSLTAAAPALAQMDNVVEVENSYKPVVKDANKINILPDVVDTKAKHYSVEYAKAAIPVKGYIFQPMGVAGSAVEDKGAKKGFATLAGGNGGNLLGRLAYGLDFTRNDRLNLDFTFRGHNGEVESTVSDDSFNEDWKSRFYTTRGAVAYEHKFTPRSSLIVQGGYESQVFNYQSFFYSQGASSTTDKQHNNLADFSVRLTPYNLGGFSVGASLGYQYFGQKRATGLFEENKENTFIGSVNLGYEFNGNNAAGVDLGLRSTSWSMDEFESVTSFTVTPHYTFKNNAMSLRIGAVLTGVSGYESEFRVAPDVRFEYKLSADAQVYAEASGGEVANTCRRLNAMSPYWSYDISAADKLTAQLPDQFDQLRATGGIRFGLPCGLNFDLSAGYDISKNRAELAPLASYGRFDITGGDLWAPHPADGNLYSPVFTADGNRFRFNAVVRYDYKDRVNINLSNQFNSWTIDKDNEVYLNDVAWRPVVDLDWNAAFRIVNTLRLGLDWRLQTFKDDAQSAYERPTTCNLGASLSYTFPIGLSLYVRGDNLLNQNYDNFFGYRALGVNFLAGAAITF